MDFTQRLNAYVDVLIAMQGSDLHFVAGSKPFMRAGRAIKMFEEERALESAEVQKFFEIIVGQTTPDGLKKLHEEKNIICNYTHESKTGTVYFRVLAFVSMGNVCLALRYVPGSIPSITELHLPESLYAIQSKKKEGLFLITGPTGHGKSTTMAAIIDYINGTQAKNIYTIEEPIEYMHHGKQSVICQREVPRDAASFQSALDYAMRADADIIAIGEMRERGVIQTAIAAAETGHLVLSTLHTNSASQTVHRILNNFDAAEQKQVANQLSYSLIGIVSIRLVPALGGGVMPACEVMFVNEAVAKNIRDMNIAGIDFAIQTGGELGMVSMEQALVALVKSKKISFDEALKHSNDSFLLEKYKKDLV